MQGVNHKILKVDLTKQEFRVDEHDDNFYRKYIGGRGFALYYMHKEMDPEVDPFSPDNMLVFAASIIVGAQGPAIPRLTVCSKSPLTNGFGESEAGGYWAPELKKAGFDAVVITGKAEKPTYLYIEDGQIEFKDASHLWGKVTGEVQSEIRKDHGDERVQVAQIGPGGENLVRYACITNNLGHFNGRNGHGAVMGSKNLKAIAVRGRKDLELADKDKVLEINRWTAKEGMKNPLGSSLHEVGTWGTVASNQEAGALPTRNWNLGQFDQVDEISAKAWNESIAKKGRGCFACPIRCKRVVEVTEGKYQVDPKNGGPEYETVGSFGSTLEIADREVIAKANELCNKYTLDTISTGMTIAFAMEAFENGLLTEEDTGGVKLEFGNGDGALKMIEMIASREGLGDLLAEGSLRAAKEIGQEALKYTHQVKGQEVPMHDPRVKTGVGIQYATAGYGADHMKAPHDPFYATIDSYGTKTTKSLGIYDPVDPLSLGEDKVRLYINLDIYWTLIDILGACCFGYAPRGPVSLE
ncbi:MAG: aldehyde ferredoxin oxidoreductase family protein, partial [Halarsenatibacteraceae bacterium]